MDISINEISDISCITTEDTISTLQHLGLIKYYKGQNCVCLTPDTIEVCSSGNQRALDTPLITSHLARSAMPHVGLRRHYPLALFLPLGAAF